jgi:3-oxoacyl-[acyl-carrier protein] reductase
MRVALVTGASRGLGAAIAVELARSGWVIAVNYAHDDVGAMHTVETITTVGGKAAQVKFDVTDPKAIGPGIAAIVAQLGPIDLLVNNATGPQGAVPIMEQTWDLYERHLGFFVQAPLLLLQAVLPNWRTRKSGRVINIGSEVIDVGSPMDGHYVAAKAAMLGLTRSWASELGPEGITVNMVSPGWTPVERHAGVDPIELASHLTRVPLARMGLPADVAAMVVFLASDAASYTTGQNFAVNGGRTYR